MPVFIKLHVKLSAKPGDQILIFEIWLNNFATVKQLIFQ